MQITLERKQPVKQPVKKVIIELNFDEAVKLMKLCGKQPWTEEPFYSIYHELSEEFETN